MTPKIAEQLHACRCCGLIQTLPQATSRHQIVCARCGTTLHPYGRVANHHIPYALAALILYPVAVSLPMLEIHQFGHRSQTSIIGGIASLFGAGNFALGLIVLLCSVVVPLGKLVGMLSININADFFTHRHRAFTYRLIEWAGRWGMLDVLLVAILIAALKLGNVMDVSPGPAATAFATCVALSIMATATFDPHRIWNQETA